MNNLQKRFIFKYKIHSKHYIQCSKCQKVTYDTIPYEKKKNEKKLNIKKE